MHEWKKQSNSCSVAEELASTGSVAPLEQREVGTAENGLRLAKGIDLVSAGLLAHLEVLEEPVALGMEGRDILPQDHELLAGGGLVALALLKLCLHVGLRSLPVGQRLRVHG
eukprot:CAMPEP_0177178490 /NCGR_PEP_ID=MMETSP0367-20130122/14355_1 /TAXON_ID=447022 ORGANISM="Scrippsiella hangoei-like, Strain SHHI-4" /NCGR_SAMPLE_ID=MMETSP0367 /ASSEMBLY_ACC=CAM_ASM_000362 /LENGTH=111 /DNA_ID=CAMNT_0018625149 /DNA_START=69 /DNA_END=400 /DNA_ORIENTATION=+